MKSLNGSRLSRRSPTRGALSWLKTLILPAAKTHASRKITAIAIVAAAAGGLKTVDPQDDFARVFRAACALGGVAGFVWLFALLVFPPRA